MKRVVATGMIFTLLTTGGLTGCTQKADEINSKDSKTTVESKGDTPQIDENITWETADLSWKKDTSPITFTTFIDHSWYPTVEWGKDFVSEEITKLTGVSLEATKRADANQLGVLIAANNLPDLVFAASNAERLNSSHVSYSWDELIPKAAPEFMSLIGKDEIVNNTQDDGHFYTLKSHYLNDKDYENPAVSVGVGEQTLFYEQGMMEKLGNPKIESVDDLYNVLMTVKEEYPDIIPFLPDPQWNASLMAYFGLTSGMYEVVDGKAQLGIVNEGFREYFKYFNKLYREGLVSKEAFVYKPEQYKQIMTQGKVFATTGMLNAGEQMNKIYQENNIDAWLVPQMDPLKVNGEMKFSPTQQSLGWSGIYISNNNKNPERAMQYMEFLKSPEGDRLTQWGREGVDYTLDEDGYPVYSQDYLELPWEKRGTGLWYFQASGLLEHISNAAKEKADPTFNVSVKIGQHLKPYYNRDLALAWCNPQADTDETIAKAQISEIYRVSWAPIVIAETEEEAMRLYDKMMQEVKAAGVDMLNEYINMRYQKYKPLYE